MTNSCTCKAEHWQPHKVDCPAYKPSVWTCEWCGAKHSSMEAYREHQRLARHPGSVEADSVSTLRLLAKCGSMDLSALGAIADEMERLQALLTEVHNHGENSELHRRIGQALGGVDACGDVPAFEPEKAS